MFGHELGHIVGNLAHADTKSNLMWDTPGEITSTPPQLTQLQCEGVTVPILGTIGGVQNNPASNDAEPTEGIDMADTRSVFDEL